MSLINDALKKAQNRHGDSTPATPAAAGPAAIPGRPSGQSNRLARGVILGAIATLFLVSASVGVTLYLIRQDEPPVPAAPAPTPAVVASSPTPAAAVSPVVSTPAPAPAVPDASPPPPNAVAPADAPAASPVVQATPASPVVSAPPAVLEPAPPAIKLGTRIQAFIDRLRITSIRISDTGNKVILNDRLFRTNDLVEPSLGLRLTDIQPKQLTFTDESGATYIRHF